MNYIWERFEGSPPAFCNSEPALCITPELPKQKKDGSVHGHTGKTIRNMEMSKCFPRHKGGWAGTGEVGQAQGRLHISFLTECTGPKANRSSSLQTLTEVRANVGLIEKMFAYWKITSLTGLQVILLKMYFAALMFGNTCFSTNCM